MEILKSDLFAFLTRFNRPNESLKIQKIFNIKIFHNISLIPYSPVLHVEITLK